jgi:hypothetical protein
MDYINIAEAVLHAVRGKSADCGDDPSLDRYAEDGNGLHAVGARSSEPIGQCGLLTQSVDGLPELGSGTCFLPIGAMDTLRKRRWRTSSRCGTPARPQ